MLECYTTPSDHGPHANSDAVQSRSHAPTVRRIVIGSGATVVPQVLKCVHNVVTLQGVSWCARECECEWGTKNGLGVSMSEVQW